MSIKQVETIKILKSLLSEVSTEHGWLLEDDGDDANELYQCWYCEAKASSDTSFDHDADCLITRIKAQLKDGAE